MFWFQCPDTLLFFVLVLWCICFTQCNQLPTSGWCQAVQRLWTELLCRGVKTGKHNVYNAYIVSCCASTTCPRLGSKNVCTVAPCRVVPVNYDVCSALKTGK